MARFKDTMLGRTGYGDLTEAPLLNLGPGGQNGHQSDLRYFHANTDYVSRQLIAKVLEVPRGLLLLDDRMSYVNALKAIVETYAQTWEGLTQTTEVAVTSTPVSGAGEEQQTPSKTTRPRSEPVLGMPDKYNLTASRLFKLWIDELLMDPDSGYANIYTRQGVSTPTDHLPDMYAMTVLFFEPDPTFKFVNKAWLCGNMFPLTSGEITSRRDKTAEGELSQLSIRFSALTQIGRGVDDLANQILRSMTITGTNPNLRPAFQQNVSADVLASQYGYVEKVNRDSTTFLRP